MRLPHRLQGQKVKSQGHGARAYCGGHLAAQLVSPAKNRQNSLKRALNDSVVGLPPLIWCWARRIRISDSYFLFFVGKPVDTSWICICIIFFYNFSPVYRTWQVPPGATRNPPPPRTCLLRQWALAGLESANVYVWRRIEHLPTEPAAPLAELL